MAAQKTPIVVICGQTATGKSSLGLKLAKKYGGEIICADSRTVYRGMDIGTAKPSSQDRREAVHHLLDIADPDERYTVADFKRDAAQVIDKIAKKGKLPILVGGGGLYIDSVIFDYDFDRTSGAKDRETPRNNTLLIGLKLPKEELKERIKERAKIMIDSGLAKETRALADKYGWNPPAGGEPMNTPEYRAARDYLEMNTTTNEFLNKIIQGDLALAKKQLTWFRRNKNISWIDSDKQAETLVKAFVSKFDTIDS